MMKLNKIKGFNWISEYDGMTLATYIIQEGGEVKSNYYESHMFRPNINTEEELIRFMKSRIVPKNRTNLQNYLDNIGIKEYNVEEIFIVTKGRTTDDTNYAEIIYK